MSPAPLRILLVEDDEDDYVLTRDLLRQAGSGWFELEWASTYPEGLAAIRRGAHDVYLLDYHLGARNGLDLLRESGVGEGPQAVIFLTGDGAYDVDLAAMHAGAAEYLIKSQINAALLERAIRYAVERARRLQELRQAETARAASLELVSRSHADLLAILNRLRLGILMTDDQGRITFASQACQHLLRCGPPPPAIPWQEACPFDPTDRERLAAMLARPPAQREKLPVHLETAGGRQYWMEVEIHDDPRDPQRKIFFLYDTSEVHALRRMLAERAHFQDLIGKSKPMQLVYQQIVELAKVDTTVLVEGETGTGKELVARAIHFASARKDRPFLAINCAGLTESLLASQLFGHRRGAFTGAVEDQQGVFEAANGGTVSLDEIGDISLSAQANLLRVLQEREITRVGEVRPRKVDVRIIAATHRDLNHEVAQQRFRADLLYRVRVARIQLPPLRERRVDIPLLIEAFLGRFRAASGRDVAGVSEDALGLLLNYAWPGNVRELQSAIECAAIRCKQSTIQAGDLPPELFGQQPGSPPVPNGSLTTERHRIVAALEFARGNRVKAARLLGMSRATLYRRLAELRIESPEGGE